MDLTRPLRKTTLVTTAILAAILAAILWACSGHVAAARGQDEATSRPAQERAGNNAAHPTLHLSGCVERGVIPGSFMLTQVRVAGTDAVAGGTDPGRPPGTSGTSNGRSIAAAAANIRQLDAETIRTVAGTCSPATDRR